MRILRIISLVAAAVVAVSCEHIQESRSDWFGSYGKLMPPRDGKIEVCVTQDVKRAGVLWLDAGATIDEVEALVKPDRATGGKAMLTIYRLDDNGRVHHFRYNLAKQTKARKALIRVQHGDILNFWYGSHLAYSS